MGFLKLIVQVFFLGGEGWAPWTQEVGVRRVGVRRVGPNPEKVGARRVEGPKFRSFFFPLPPQNWFFSSLSWGLLVEFWWCLKRLGAQMCWGVSHDSPRTPIVHILGSRPSKTPPKFHEETPREGRKERILRREREKKERNFGRSRGRAVPGRAVPGAPNIKPKP